MEVIFAILNIKSLYFFIIIKYIIILQNFEFKELHPNLFELDYLDMSKERTKIIEQELMTKALHPSTVSKWLDYHIENGGDICDFEY